MEQPNKRLGINHGELLAASIVIISAILMFWKTTDVRLSALELRMNNKEKTDEQINAKLDKLQDGINEVKIALQNKQDKK
ncbi:MAG: hypothetical protein WCH59_09365 [Chitinophagia bacterium]|jgi:hypothetical protein